MKITLFLTFLLIQNAFAQKAVFPTDENGKYTFIEIVDLPEMKSERLFRNGQAFMDKIEFMDSKENFLAVDENNNSIQTKGRFSVHNYGSIKKHIDGIVSYSILLEIKDGKYRYTITDFVFNPYERNRYGKFVPVNGKTTPLEVAPSKLNQKNWNQYRSEVYEKTFVLIQNLNKAMSYDETSETIKIKKETNW